jgi:hypothetical protein
MPVRPPLDALAGGAFVSCPDVGRAAIHHACGRLALHYMHAAAPQTAAFRLSRHDLHSTRAVKRQTDGSRTASSLKDPEWTSRYDVLIGDMIRVARVANVHRIKIAGQPCWARVVGACGQQPYELTCSDEIRT